MKDLHFANSGHFLFDNLQSIFYDCQNSDVNQWNSFYFIPKSYLILGPLVPKSQLGYTERDELCLNKVRFIGQAEQLMNQVRMKLFSPIQDAKRLHCPSKDYNRRDLTHSVYCLRFDGYPMYAEYRRLQLYTLYAYVLNKKYELTNT